MNYACTCMEFLVETFLFSCIVCYSECRSFEIKMNALNINASHTQPLISYAEMLTNHLQHIDKR